MKKLAVVMGVLVMLIGCAVPRHNIRQVEVSRDATLNNPQMRAGSIFLDVNPFTCTWVVDRIYRGQLSREQAFGNVNGRAVFFNDYLHKIELTNAIAYNRENPASAPNVARIMLDPNTVYTVVRYVGWGRWLFQKDYAVEIFYLRPSSNPIGQCWTNNWNQSECASVVSIASGSNEASYASLNLQFQVNGTQLGRDALGSLMEVGRR